MASSGASSSLASLLRLASWVICLIVLASFVTFVVEQTSSASTHQQEEINEHPSSPGAPGPKHESAVHKKIDEASNFFTSPFAGIVSGSSSQWVIHLVKTALALFVYGFVLSYLARVIRVRV
jgi:predicted PurR-regulated permease PerM